MDNIDHLGRNIMNIKDREEWISRLWIKQVLDLIKKGNRNEWEYKKGKTNFLKLKKWEIKTNIEVKRNDNRINYNNRNRELGNFKRREYST